MGQAILVKMVDGRMAAEVVPESADLVAWMAVRGHELTGMQQGRRLRPELQGAPMFSGLLGPMWGGEEHPLRYEDSASNDLLSI